MSPNESRRFIAVLVIFKSMSDRQTGHADIDARLLRVAFRIQAQNRRFFQRSFRKQNHIDAVVERLPGRS